MTVKVREWFSVTLIGALLIISVTTCAITDNAGRSMYARDCVTSGGELIHGNCMR